MLASLVVLLLAALDVGAEPASGQPQAGLGAGPIAPGRALPRVAEHRYSVTARIRPLLFFWISRDNVGEAILTWRAGADGRLGFELLIGSDPDHAPRRVNQWGYIAEEVGPNGAALLGVMKDSDDKTLEEAQKRVQAEGGRRQFVYKAIRTQVAGNRGTTGTTRVTLDRDPTFREVEWVLAQLPASPPAPREYPLAVGVKPGYLPTLQALIQESVAWHQRGERAAESPVGCVVQYVFNGTMYDLVLRSSTRLASGRYRGRTFEDLIEGEFCITNKTTGEKTRFEVQFPRAGSLAGVPVHGVFRPRWWFEVEMTMNDPADRAASR